MENDLCISHALIVIMLLNVLKGSLAYQIKKYTTTTTITTITITITTTTTTATTTTQYFQLNIGFLGFLLSMSTRCF